MYVNKVFDPIQSKMYVWDADVLDWVAWEGGTSGTGPATEVEITNWPASQAINDGSGSITVDGIVDVAKYAGMSVRVDEASSTITYIGEAPPGASEATSSWRIKKMDTTTGVVITWAGGVDSFTNRWDQRASLSYS
jgi:hypothetical protein